MLVTKSAFHHLKNISRLRSSLSDSVTETLIHAFVTSRLDYCNGVLSGVPRKTLDRLQYVQNSFAFITSSSYSPTSPFMHLPPSTWLISSTNTPHPGACGHLTLVSSPSRGPSLELSVTEPLVWLPPPSGTLSPQKSATLPLWTVSNHFSKLTCSPWPSLFKCLA